MKNILVINQKGGVGKTYLADEIAYSFDRTNTPYTYYDLDIQPGADHKTQERDDAIVTIVDTPGAITDDLPGWLMDADIIVVPVKAGMRDQGAFENIRQAIGTHAPKKPVVVVLNMWTRYTSSKEFEEWLRESLNENETLMLIPASEAVQRAGMTHQSVTDYNRRSLVAHRTREVTNKIRELAGLALEEDIPAPAPRKK